MISKPNKICLWTRSLFVTYILLLVWLVLFKLDFVIPHRARDVNLIPFYYQSVANWRLPVREAVANVVAFLPMGIYLKMLSVRNRFIVIGGFATSFAFEIIQFAFAMGIADVTDLITNTLGTVCGMLLYILLCRLFASTERVNRGLLMVGMVGTVLAEFYFIMTLSLNALMAGLLAAFLGG